MKQVKGLDYRSIGLFRIILGLVVLLNLVTMKWAYFNKFFSPENGFIPEPLKQNSNWSVFFGSESSVLVFFGIATLCSIFLSIGYLSRCSAAVLCLFYGLYNTTFFHLTFGFDRYIEVMLFIAILLPLEDRFAVTTNSRIKNNVIAYNKWPAFLAILQIALIYSISGFSKNGVMWVNGTAVGALLLDDLLAKPFATSLYSKSFLMHFLNYATILFEALAIFLLFIPWKNQIARIIFGILIVSFHWGLSIFVDVGFFKWIGTAAVVLILPALFWDKLSWLESALERIENRVSSAWYNFKILDNTKLQLASKILAVAVFYGIVMSNLSMISTQGDAMGKFMRNGNSKSVFQNLNFKGLNGFSTVFKQNWYFYAPNPNIHLGKISFVGVKYNDAKINLETNKSYVPGDYVLKENKDRLRNFFNTKMRNDINKNSNADLALDYSRFLVNKWEKDNQEYLKAMIGYNYYFNGRKIMQGEPKSVTQDSIIMVDLHQMRMTN